MRIFSILMNPWSISLSVFALVADPTAWIDRACSNGYCTYLVLRSGEVRVVDPVLHRDLFLGQYLKVDERFVPRREAPIRDLRSEHGWHIVITATLDHKERSAETRLRFFSPSHELTDTYQAMLDLEFADLGPLFGGKDEILAVTSNEEHAYNVRTIIWQLPPHGRPKQLLDVAGMVVNFVRSATGLGPGIWIDRQTYDGFHSETKRWMREFWRWSEKTKSLTLSAPTSSDSPRPKTSSSPGAR